MSEHDRRGMAAIRNLHATALGSSRAARQLRDEDTRLRCILADIDTNDQCIIEAWVQLVRAIVAGRSQRRDDERRSRRMTTGDERNLRQQFIDQGFDDEIRRPLHTSSNMRSRMTTVVATRNALRASGSASASPAADIHYPRRRSAREYRSFDPEPLEWELVDTLTPFEMGQPSRDRPVMSPPPVHANPSALLNWLDSPPPPEAAAEGVLHTERALERFPTTLGNSMINIGDHALVMSSDEPPTEPPAALDRASPAPVPGTRDRSSSPDEASRAWLAEYEAMVPRSAPTSSIFTLGRRRREDDSGPSTGRRRLRHTDGGRDTRRDAVIFSPEGWLDTVLSREGGEGVGVWRVERGAGLSVASNVGSTSHAGSTTGETAVALDDEVTVIGEETVDATAAPSFIGTESDAEADADTDAPAAPEAPEVVEDPVSETLAVDDPPALREAVPLTRTMSLSAVGRGERPVAPLPRRRTSLLSGLE